MRAYLVVVFPPFLDQDLGFSQAVEDFAIQELVSEARVEAFTLSVLPGAARLDLCRFRANRLDPVLYGLSNELRAVARREEALFIGYGHARSPQIAQRVAITGSQVSTVVLHEPH